MITFTTRQREILKIILEANRSVGSVELANMLHITSRQVNYSMKGVIVWLHQHDQDLSVVPGVGFAVKLTADQTRTLSPLMSLKEIQEHLPEVVAKLGDDLMWTNEAEEVLTEKMWEKSA
jgi:transcriptional antiterminator